MAVSMELTITKGGIGSIAGKMRALAGRTPSRMAAALVVEARVEMQESMRRTPVKTGALRDSHEVQAAEMNGRDVEVTIAVGGPQAPYAVYVHENLEAHHDIGQAKFLESTLRESAPFMAARLAARMKLEG